MPNVVNYATGTIASTNDVVSFSPNGDMKYTSTGTWSGTIVIQYSYDGTTWLTAKTYTANPTNETEFIPATKGVGAWRVIATSWSSGTATIWIGHA